MANKDYGQTYYPLGSENVQLASYLEQMAESLEGRTIRSFTSTAARDTALNTLTAEQKKGVVAHVQGKGLYYYTGSVWRYVQGKGDNFTQSGVFGGFTQPTGYVIIPFNEPFGGVPNVTAQHLSVLYQANHLSITISKIPNGYTITNSSFHVYVQNPDGTPYNNYIDISWIAHGPRAAD